MKKIFSMAVGGSLFLQGCVITNSPGFHSGYEKLTVSERARIQFVPPNQPLAATNGSLCYAVEANNILNSVHKMDTTLVYTWSPVCHSKVCLPLQNVQAYCTRKGYNLYVVAEYYDVQRMDMQPQLKNPLLVINHKYYHSDYCPRYTKLFDYALRRGQAVPDSAKYFRYYLFSGNTFIRAVRTI